MNVRCNAPPPPQIGLEARSQDAATSQLQWECCRCVQSWGTELLPRLGQYAEAARRVAAKNAAAARMTQHVMQQQVASQPPNVKPQTSNN